MSQTKNSSDVRYSTFKASELQSEFMNSTTKQIMLYGGFGGGKTRTLNEKIYRLSMMYPGSRSLIVRKKFSDVAGSTIEQSLIEDVIPEDHIPEGGWNKSAHKVEHLTGHRDEYGEPITSEIYYEGLDAKGTGVDDSLPRRISGMQFSFIGVDEATEITEDDYTQLLGRLRFDGRVVNNKKYRIPFRQLIVATNPGPPSHHLYERFRPDDESEGVGECYHLKPHDNPGIPDDYVQQLEDNYSGVAYERYVEGKWIGASDVIYDKFNRRDNVVGMETLRSLDSSWEESWVYDELAGYPIPPETWDVYRTVDFGYPSPMVCQWWARSPENDQSQRVWVLFREFYKSETMVDELAKYVKKFSKDLEITQTYVDPAQASDREELNREGVSSQPAEKDVWNGIQRVKAQMDRSYQENPGVLFYEDALVNDVDQELDEANKPARTVDEIGGYEWKRDSDKPKKEDDHGMDAMRYAIFSVERTGGTWTQQELEELEEMMNNGF